jgi:hypothetical protein
MFNRQINRQFDQYIAENEEKEDNTRDKITNLVKDFKALAVKVKRTNITKESDIFITEAEHLIKQTQATNIVQKLLNKAVTHTLLKNNNLYNYINNKCFVTD